jgi:hypothetical protein
MQFMSHETKHPNKELLTYWRRAEPCRWSTDHKLELFVEMSNDLLKQILHFNEDAKHCSKMYTKTDIFAVCSIYLNLAGKVSK